MKVFRKVTTMLCVLALLLSLAPTAFAEEEVCDAVTTEVTSDTGKIYEGTVVISEEGSIKVTDNDISDDKFLGGYSGVAAGGDIINEGTVSVERPAEVPGAGVMAGGDVVNFDTITVEGGQDSGLRVTGDIVNVDNGTIDVKSAGDAIVAAGEDNLITGEAGEEQDIMNFGKISVEAEGKSVIRATNGIYNGQNSEIKVKGDEVEISADGGLVNEGTIEAEGNTVTICEDTFNLGTIKTTVDGVESVYYAVNYVDENGEVIGSALGNWQDGKSDGATVCFWDEEQKDGYTFGGWNWNGQRYEASTIVSGVKLDGVSSITAIWNKILAAASSGDDGVKAEKSGEKIVKYMDGYKVLDADRKEMKIETEYFKVAKTSYNRLIVVFTWRQMAEMEEGEHLFYIVSPDNVETEYTLTIW